MADIMAIKAHFLNLIRNSSVVFLLGLAAGLGFGGGASVTKPAVTPILGMVMTLSILNISLDIFGSFRKMLSRTLIASILNYGVLTSTLIGLSWLIIGDAEIYAGFVLLAAVPPAVAVIPFTFRLGGDTELSLVGEAGTYFLALAITPLIGITLLGANLIDPARLLAIIAGLIVGPLVLSSLLQKMHLSAHLCSWREPLIDWGFFLLIYTMVGLNRDEILHQPQELANVLLVAFVATFVLAELIEIGSRFLGATKSERISFLFLSTRKNTGLAGAIALTLFDSRVAIPAAIFGAVSVFHFVWLNWRVRRMV